MPKSGHNGSRWISPARRLAVYRRDGFTCLYCDAHLATTDRNLVTLDHVIVGNGDGCDNLVTACKRCNALKGNGPYYEFVMRTHLPQEANRIIHRIHSTLSCAVISRDIRAAGAAIKNGTSEWGPKDADTAG